MPPACETTDRAQIETTNTLPKSGTHVGLTIPTRSTRSFFAYGARRLRVEPGSEILAGRVLDTTNLEEHGTQLASECESMPTSNDFETGGQAGDRRERRYLRVTIARLDVSDVNCSAYMVDCPRRRRVGLETCVMCAESGRIRFHRGGQGPMTIECSFLNSKVRALRPAPRNV